MVSFTESSHLGVSSILCIFFKLYAFSLSLSDNNSNLITNTEKLFAFENDAWYFLYGHRNSVNVLKVLKVLELVRIFYGSRTIRIKQIVNKQYVVSDTQINNDFCIKFKLFRTFLVPNILWINLGSLSSKVLTFLANSICKNGKNK